MIPKHFLRSTRTPPSSSRKGRASATRRRPSAKGGKRKRTPKPRCGHPECKKRLNITNGFPCRCQRVFCAKHRHPELHGCTFDYKEEGRRLLEKANPVITFPKLPKI